MPTSRTVASEILRILSDAGVTTAFGLPGVHNLPFWNALGEDRPEIIGVRHEQTCVYAADGLARTTGGLGVALTTTGPGAANAIGAFGEAAISNSAVLVISSEAPIASRLPGMSRGLLHEMVDQSALFAPLAKKDRSGRPLAMSVANAKEAIEAALRLVAELQAAPRGAGYLGVPADILAMNVEDDEFAKPTIEELKCPPNSLLQLRELIDTSEKIALWVGGGAVDSSHSIARFAELLGAPIFTSFAGRGIGATSSNYVDMPIHEPEISNLFSQADLLIVIASELDGMNTKNWKLPWPPKIAIIDAAPAKPAANSGASLILETSDINGVIDELSKRDKRENWADIKEICDGVRSRLHASKLESQGLKLVETIDQSWGIEDPVICDMAISGYWVGVYGRHSKPRRSAYPVGWGTLGFALPASIGAATKKPTLVICGDGGLAFALSELATIKQENLPITILLNDDGGYGMLRYDQQVMSHPERGVDLFNPEWSSIASSFGFHFEEVDLDSLGTSLKRAHASQGQNLLLLRTKLYPPRSTSPRWKEA